MPKYDLWCFFSLQNLLALAIQIKVFLSSLLTLFVQNKVVIFVAADQFYSFMNSPMYYTQVDASVSVLMNAHLNADLNDGLCAGAAPPGSGIPSQGAFLCSLCKNRIDLWKNNC